MPRHKPLEERLILHDGVDPLAYRNRWNFTGTVNAVDNAGLDETTVTVDEGSPTFINDQWVQYINLAFDPTVPIAPYRVDLGEMNFESDNQSLVGPTTNLALGQFGFATTGMYVVNFRAWYFPSTYPAQTHSYQIFTGARTTYWHSQLEIASGEGGGNTYLVANIQLADWFATDETLYVRMQRGTTITNVGTGAVDFHVARIL